MTWTATGSRNRRCREILLPDEEAEIGPVPTSAGGHPPEPELDRLSNILRTFNEHFGDIHWEDADRVQQLITETIPARVAADTAFRNAPGKNSDRENARIEHDQALLRVMTAVMKDDTVLFKQFMDNSQLQALAHRHRVHARLRADCHATYGRSIERPAVGLCWFLTLALFRHVISVHPVGQTPFRHGRGAHPGPPARCS